MEITIHSVKSIKITDVHAFSKETGAANDFKTRMIYIMDDKGNLHTIRLFTYTGDLEVNV